MTAPTRASEPLTAGPIDLAATWPLAGALNAEAASGLMPTGPNATVERVKLLTGLGPSSMVSAADGTPLGMGGCAELLPGVAEAWALIGYEVTRRGLGLRFARFARWQLDQWIRQWPAWHRVYACVPAGSDRFDAWARCLGMRYEARLRQARTDRGDLKIYVRFPKG